ncbi:MAG: hypothetical protein CTY20_13190 [Hyphomicrobium sp.]|nr:MAG: hypothetical protein CTY20_13190 [Hyphomicrobium sp.]
MRIDQNLILLPVIAQVILTFAVLVMMGRARAQSMRERRQKMDDVALATATDWNENARKLANNYANQFETPVLFYVACLFALVTRSVDVALMVLALVFVASRIAHTAIHIGANRVTPRFTAFLVGVAALMGMWALLGWRVLTAAL